MVTEVFSDSRGYTHDLGVSVVEYTIFFTTH